jgi:hypothetical protein
MKKLRIALLLTFALGIIVGNAAAQARSQNLIAGAQAFNWKHLSTDHFDVHFYSNDPVLAGSASRYAEENFFHISKTLDYKPRSRYQIFIYLSPGDFIQSNQFPQNQSKEGGNTPLHNASSTVIYQGNALQLHKDIGTQVARMIMDEFYYGGSIQNTIQNSVLLYEPRWFEEGFPSWLGEGWTVEDEMWISSLGSESILDFAIDGSSPINHTVRKSVWYFIVQQYGAEKLSELFYMTRLQRSAEAGVIRVLGINLHTLTERWREFMLERISENNEAREILIDKATRIPLKKEERLIGMAQNPVKPEAALCIEHKGKQKVVIYNIESGVFQETGIEGGFTTRQFEALGLTNAMAWSSDGKQLAAVYFDGSEEQLAWYDSENGTFKTTAVRPGLERVYEIAWNHENSLVAVSGLRTGQVDIFVATPGSAQFEQATDDLYDDRHPLWSLDDHQLFFSSNRPQPADSIKEFPYKSWNFSTDVYRTAWPTDKEGPVQVTHTIAFNEFPVSTPSSFEIVYLTDEAGIINLKKQNIFLGDSTFITNLTQGMVNASLSDSLVLFTSPWKGAIAAWTTSSEEFYTEGAVINTRLRHYISIEQQKALKAIEDKQKRSLDSLVKSTLNPPVKTSIDSPQTDTTRRVKYYVFDDDDPGSKESDRRRKVQRSQNQAKKKAEVPVPDFGEVMPKGPNETKSMWSADRISTRIGFDPVFKLNMTLEAGLHDIRGDQQLTIGYRPYLNLKCGDFYANYSYLKKKVDLHAGIERSSRFLDKNNYFFRYNSLGARVGATLPLNRFTSVSGGIRYSNLARYHLDPFALEPLNGTAHLVSASGSLQHDTREFAENFVKRGEYFHLTAREAFSFTGMQQNFVSLTTDLRKYLRLGRHIVLATRATGGYSFGNVPQVFYLGGTDDWLFSKFGNAPDFPMNQDISSFHFMEYVSPIRGFFFNARNGSKYFALNAELRMPISRMVLGSLNTNSPYNVELIPFCDFGTAWHEGNPLSQKNPISTEIIDQYPLYIEVQTLRSPFVMGFGSGLRLTVFGYSTRLDLAWGVEDYSIQKPKVHFTLGKNF